MSAIFDFSSLITVLLLAICTTTYLRELRPTIFDGSVSKTDDVNSVSSARRVTPEKWIAIPKVGACCGRTQISRHELSVESCNLLDPLISYCCRCLTGRAATTAEAKTRRCSGIFMEAEPHWGTSQSVHWRCLCNASGQRIVL